MNAYGLPQLMQPLTVLTDVLGITQVAHTTGSKFNEKQADSEAFAAMGARSLPLSGKECVA